MQNEMDRLKTTLYSADKMTPRPDYSAIQGKYGDIADAKHVTTVSAVEKMASKLHASEQQTMELQAIKEFIGMKDKQFAQSSQKKKPSQWFLGLGEDEALPKFLRYSGRMRNTNMQKKDAESLIKQFWSAKQKLDRKLALLGTKYAHSNVKEFFYDFLKDKLCASVIDELEQRKIICEYAYNMMYILRVSFYDVDCLLFYQIVFESLDEEVYHDQRNVVERFQATILAKAQEKKRKKFNRKGFIKAMKGFFHLKSVERINELVQCLDSQISNQDTIDVESLFAEDEDFNQGPFPEALRTQHIHERDEYLADIESSLIELDNDSDGMLSLQDIQIAVQTVDSDIPFNALDDMLSKGLDMKKEALGPVLLHNKRMYKTDAIVGIRTFMGRISKLTLRRYTARDG